MPTTTSARIQDHFNNLTDPRRRKVTYPLINIVTIAQEIIDAEADYVLAAKDNQKTLRQGISWFFLSKQAEDFRGVRVSRYETHEKGHGREDTRQYFVSAAGARLVPAQALAGPEGDRLDHQHDGARRPHLPGDALLHP